VPVPARFDLSLLPRN